MGWPFGTPKRQQIPRCSASELVGIQTDLCLLDPPKGFSGGFKHLEFRVLSERLWLEPGKANTAQNALSGNAVKFRVTFQWIDPG